MSDRIFTQEEIERAESLLLLLANESSRFWAEAFLSPAFLYQGEVWYMNSDFYKNSGWRDKPNNNHDTITGEQIMKFISVYMTECKKKINKLLESDMAIAEILGLESRLTNVDWSLHQSCRTVCFGGWDNDPMGEVATAKKEAGLDGPMSVKSPYRKTRVTLHKGEIYWGWKKLN